MGVKNSGMKKFYKFKRNEFSSILHSELKMKNSTYPQPQVFQKLVSLGLETKPKTDPENADTALIQTPSGNLVDILLTFSDIYVKLWDGSEVEMLEKLKTTVSMNQISNLLNRIKNLLNANEAKCNELHEECYSAILDLGMVTLKISRLLQGRTDHYSTYWQAFERCALEYYENQEENGKAWDFMKLLKCYEICPENFMAAMTTAKFLSELCVHSRLLENPTCHNLAVMIKNQISSSITPEKQLLLDPKDLEILKNGTLVQICNSDSIFDTESRVTFFTEMQSKLCGMVKALVENAAVFDAVTELYDEMDSDDIEDIEK